MSEGKIVKNNHSYLAIIPRAMCKALKLTKGAAISFQLDGKEIVMKKIRDGKIMPRYNKQVVEIETKEGTARSKKALKEQWEGRLKRFGKHYRVKKVIIYKYQGDFQG